MSPQRRMTERQDQDTAALIARLEKATGPDRELDSLIAQSLEAFPTEPFKGGAPFERLEGMYWVKGKKDTPAGPVEERWSKNPPLYTFSIDAALTLVPEGESWSVLCFDTGRAQVEIWNEMADGPTPAIALCIAALKARGDSQ